MTHSLVKEAKQLTTIVVINRITLSMNRLTSLIIFTLIIPLFFSCAAPQKEITTIPTLQTVRLAESALTKRLDVRDTTTTPAKPTLTFTTGDSEVISYIKLKNITEEHTLRWDWVGPKGELYSSSGDYPLNVSKGKYREEAAVWHQLSIRGDRASYSPGRWQVNVFLDNTLLVQKDFVIESDVETLPDITKKTDRKSWGFIIGIEKYSNFPSVDYAEKDAGLAKEYFIKIFGVPEENIISLSGSSATKSSIRGYLKSYIPKNVDKDTTLYVYYAGHGLPYPENNRIEPYLLPYDSDTVTIMETGYRLQDFYNDIAALPVKRAFVFLDSCFSGAASRGDKMLIAGARPIIIQVENMALLSGKVIAITSSSGGEISNSYPEKEHGLFTYFLLRGLRGEADIDNNGSINLEELYGYVRENVNKHSRRKGIEQTPEISPSLNIVKDIEISRE